ncbi:MAG: hypothetical protein QNL62_07425 [Gammaproteobacteria bacterium]|nr:hypothetical protein [Gammaproteobacteria bacterium]
MTGILAACGGGGSGVDSSPVTATGYFLDSKVEGLDYIGDKGATGSTGVEGDFKYLPDETMTFSLGDLPIGSASGQTVVTPQSLIATNLTPDEQLQVVENIVRLIIAVDENTNPDDGIVVSETLTAELTDAIDLQTTDLDGAVLGLAIAGTLPTVAEAEEHFTETLLCSFSGAFHGNWSTVDFSGLTGMIIDAKGKIYGMASDGQGISSDSTLAAVFEGNRTVDFVTNAFNASGDWYAITREAGGLVDNYVLTGEQINVAGDFESADVVSGTLSKDGIAGVMDAQRVDSNFDSAYRFTGLAYEEVEDNGVIVRVPIPIFLFTFNIDENNQVTGSGVLLEGSVLFSLTGTVVNGQITALVESNEGHARITGDINLDAGTMSDLVWTVVDNNGVVIVDGGNGIAIGSGCSLR